MADVFTEFVEESILPRESFSRYSATPQLVAIPVRFRTGNLGPAPAAGVLQFMTALELPRGWALPRGREPGLCQRSRQRNTILCSLGTMRPGQASESVLLLTTNRLGVARVRSQVFADTRDPDPANDLADVRVELAALVDSGVVRGSMRLGDLRPFVTAFSTGDVSIAPVGVAAGGSVAVAAGRSGRPRLQVAIARLEGDVAVGRAAGGRRRGSCRWVRNLRGAMRRERATGGRCVKPVWLDARQVRRTRARRGAARKGRSTRRTWRLALRRALPCGRYVVLTRAIDASGAFEAGFSARDGNRVTTRVRRRTCR